MDFLKNTSLITILTIIAGLLVLFLNPWREYKKNKLVVTLKTIAGIVIVLGVPWLDSIYREKNNKQLADIEKLGRELYSYQSDSSKEILKDTRVIKKNTAQIEKYVEALSMSGVSTSSANTIGKSLKKEIAEQPEELKLFEPHGISKGSK